MSSDFKLYVTIFVLLFSASKPSICPPWQFLYQNQRYCTKPVRCYNASRFCNSFFLFVLFDCLGTFQLITEKHCSLAFTFNFKCSFIIKTSFPEYSSWCEFEEKRPEKSPVGRADVRETRSSKGPERMNKGRVKGTVNDTFADDKQMTTIEKADF